MWDKSLPGHTQSLQHYAVKNPDYFRTSMPLAGYCNTCPFLRWLIYSLITVIKLFFYLSFKLNPYHWCLNTNNSNIFFSICLNSVFVCVKIRLVCEPFSTTRDLEKKCFTLTEDPPIYVTVFLGNISEQKLKIRVSS